MDEHAAPRLLFAALTTFSKLRPFGIEHHYRLNNRL
jgi:hypothetical protein